MEPKNYTIIDVDLQQEFYKKAKENSKVHVD